MTHKKEITIVAFGDSITDAAHQPLEGRWPERVRLALQARFPSCGFRMINAGVGGNTTREGLARIEADVLAHAPDWVLVEFGNDATPETDRHVSFDEFVLNLARIRTQVSECSGGRILLLTFPPIVDEWHCYKDNPFCQSHGGIDVYQEHYRNLTRQFARQNHVPLAETDRAIRAAMAREGAAEYILPDGVHLTAKGNQLIADTVVPVLAAALTPGTGGGSPGGASLIH